MWANDSENEGRNTITFTIDLTDPTITFITEDESTSDDLNLDITYRASDTNLDSCWYSNDSMSKNTTLTNCTNITDITWTATSHTITVWTNDSANNQNSDTITFTIEDTAPRISFLTETPIDNTFTSNQNIITNTSIIDQNIANINYNWNGTNYTIYNNSLVLMYNFDNISVLGENDTHILDITGNGYNGTTISAPYANTSGKYGGAYEFDGIDDYINTTYYDETKTISFWFKTKDFDTMKGIVGQRHDSAEESGNWQMHWSDNSPHTKLRIYTYDSGVSGGDMETSTTFDTGVWYHFAFTSEASDTRFYVNGEYDSQHTWMDTILGGGNNNDNLVIGGSFGNTVLYPFNGSLDELKVWNRTLDAEEIYQQYASNLNKHNTTQWYLYVNQSKNSTDILDDASYTYQIFTSDTANNKNSTEKRTIKIDSTKPIIQITTPNNNTFSSNANLNINYTITESNIDTCWYSNDSMSINTTLASCANITTVTWSDGQHNVTIWTNDSANNQNSSTISFNIDSNTPLISITTPNNNTFSSNANLNINYTITESNIDTCWYSNDSMSINTTLASCANITTVTWSDGQHNVTIWVNDSSNRINQTSVTFSIDTTTPLISITTPTNNTLSNNQNININYTITEANIDSCWYSNDSMSTNTTLASCANITTITWSEGQHNVTIWVNDSSNRINKSSISFTLDLSPPTYQHNNTNQTITGLPTLFSLSYADTTGLSGYIFSTNNTGQWVNDSWSAFGTGFTNMEDWTYRKSHIVEKTDNAGTNYTTKIHIINGTGTDTGDTVYINSFENNKLKTDFGDVRFTNEDSQLLNYWIENLTTTNATFWINIDGNLSASNQTIYIYYGNSSKTNVSNGTATFVFFDDFNDGIIDSNKWNSSSGITTSISESGGSGKIIGSTSGTWNVGYFKTYDTFSPGHSIIAKQYFNQVSGNIDAYSGFIDRDVVLYAGGGQTNYINLRMYRYSWVGGGAAYHDLLTSNAGVGFNQNTNNPRDAWKIIEYNWDNNYAQILFNGINQSSNSNISSIPTVSLPAGFLIDSGSGANGYTYTDWFAIRKYVETEPSHSTWGEEETASASGAINVTKTLNDTLALTISWCIYANDTANNWNHSCNPPFTVRTTSNDTVFPTFTNFITNNNTLIGTGTAIFNTTINNTNGTTWITLNNINYTATVNTNNYSTSINLTNGTHSYKWYSYGNGIHNKLNSSRTLFYTVKPDQDQDGLDDTNDTLEYNETYVIKEGITELNITVGGNSTNQTFTEKQQVIFYEETSPIINFSHNFTQSELDLSKVTIIKEETSLIVNFSGQLQENKTLFITDNEFISLCVKDEEISSVSEISSSCAGSNETDFTNCLDGQARINGINCTDLGDTIKIENLKHSGIKGTQETILSSIISGGSSGGSGTSGGITPSATTNKTKFEKKECYTNEDCPTHYHCYESQCAKLFDIKIIDATVIDGHLHFTYYIKGMAKFNNDITIKFWLEKDNTNYTEGQDIIYLGEYEEKTETTKLYLPSELEKGTYKFYIETSFEDYSATSYRTLELEKDGQEFTAALSPEEEKTRTSDFMNLIIVALLTMLIITITKITNPKDWIKEKIKLFTTKQPMKVNILEKPTEQKVEKSTKEKQKVIKLIKTKVKKITKPKVAKPVKAKTKVTKKAKHKVAKPIKAKVKKPIKAKHKPIKAKVKKPIKTKHKPVKAKTKVTKQPNLTKALLKEILKPKEEKEDKLTKGLLREILKKR